MFGILGLASGDPDGFGELALRTEQGGIARPAGHEPQDVAAHQALEQGPGLPALHVDDAAIVGTTWVLDTYITDDIAANSVGMENATLTLHDDGSFTGSTGCRPFSGEWVDSGAEIVFATFAVEGECPPELVPELFA